jgi:3',5'-cyclic AMP phosphodiesterase CpdA
MAKKIFVILILVLLLAQACLADFKFAVIGDTRSDNPEGINIKVMATLLKKIKSEDVDFIIVTGDMMTGSKNVSITLERLGKWERLVQKYGLTAYVVAGNHEINSEGSEGAFRSIFEMPDNGPIGLKELTYSFDYKNTHFVMLNTYIYGNFHMLGGLQVRWLEEDLKASIAKPIFVFGHDPAYPTGPHKTDSLDRYPEQRDMMWGIFKKYGVNIYFCGHEHLYNKSIHDGVFQIITGGGGADLHAAPEKGGFHHFVIVDIKDSGIYRILVKDIGGNIRDRFVSNGRRHERDR